MRFFDIVLRTQASLHPDGEPDDFISEHTGVIRCSGEDNVVRRVGRVRAYRINADLAANHGESLFDVCDAHSQWMHELYALLYEPGEEQFKDDIAGFIAEPHEFADVRFALRPGYLVSAARHWHDPGVDEAERAAGSDCAAELPVSGRTPRR